MMELLVTRLSAAPETSEKIDGRSLLMLATGLARSITSTAEESFGVANGEQVE